MQNWKFPRIDKTVIVVNPIDKLLVNLQKKKQKKESDDEEDDDEDDGMTPVPTKAKGKGGMSAFAMLAVEDAEEEEVRYSCLYKKICFRSSGRVTNKGATGDFFFFIFSFFLNGQYFPTKQKKVN